MYVSMQVNGKQVSGDVGPEELLVDYLRDDLGLTGTKQGCETGDCGACVVQVDDMPVKSCLMLAVQADGGSVLTIEGLSGDGELTPLQQALHDEHGTQCGFCTPGMVMSLSALLRQAPAAGEREVREWLTGNLCRCTGYQSIVRAVLDVTQGVEHG